VAENIVIIGSGPAGYTAAIYAARAGLNPLLLAGPEPGGQLITTTVIENYPGFAHGIPAFELIEAWRSQAENFGTRIKYQTVQSVDFRTRPEPLKLYLEDQSVIETLSVIIATGASAKWLGVSGEEQYKNRGISACATCDGFAFRGKDVAVIGGGDTAFEEALYLSNLCRKVYLIHRRGETGFRASKIMIERATDKQNIYFVLNAAVQSFYGDDSKLLGINYLQDGEEQTLKVDGAFVAIGHTPNTKFLVDKVATDSSGYLITKPETGTTVFFQDEFSEKVHQCIPGVFAAGDCVDRVYRQAVTAAGEGCKAALDAEKYLSTLNI
jgi:thioredoxin reductase (NADPH)